jgi:hypothetical protein
MNIYQLASHCTQLLLRNVVHVYFWTVVEEVEDTQGVRPVATVVQSRHRLWVGNKTQAVFAVCLVFLEASLFWRDPLS